MLSYAFKSFCEDFFNLQFNFISSTEDLALSHTNVPKLPLNAHIDIVSVIVVICLDFGLSPYQHVYEKRGC